MKMTPYLFLDGRCEEAIEFYKSAVGATVGMLMRYKDNPDAQPGMIPPGSDDKVMHSQIDVGGNPLMLSDGRCQGKPIFQGMALSLTVGSDAEAERIFKALGVGGQPQMQLVATFFASRFGMVADKFGVSWMVLTDAPPKSD